MTTTIKKLYCNRWTQTVWLSQPIIPPLQPTSATFEADATVATDDVTYATVATDHVTVATDHATFATDPRNRRNCLSDNVQIIDWPCLYAPQIIKVFYYLKGSRCAQVNLWRFQKEVRYKSEMKNIGYLIYFQMTISVDNEWKIFSFFFQYSVKNQIICLEHTMLVHKSE